MYIPGCSVESMTFFAVQRSGVMCWISPVLYAVSKVFARSSPEVEVKSVRGSVRSMECRTRPELVQHGEFRGGIYRFTHSDQQTYYVVRSYCEAGSSRDPGSEADMSRQSRDTQNQQESECKLSGEMAGDV